jgi:hypothetical protein
MKVRIDISTHQHKFLMTVDTSIWADLKKNENTHYKMEKLKLTEKEEWLRGGRCFRCQIKWDYLQRAIATLEGWPEKEKGKDWEEKVLGLLTCPADGSYNWKGPDRKIVFLKKG